MLGLTLSWDRGGLFIVRGTGLIIIILTSTWIRKRERHTSLASCQIKKNLIRSQDIPKEEIRSQKKSLQLLLRLWSGTNATSCKYTLLEHWSNPWPSRSHTSLNHGKHGSSRGNKCWDLRFLAIGESCSSSDSSATLEPVNLTQELSSSSVK